MVNKGIGIWGIPQIPKIPQIAVEIHMEFLRYRCLYTPLNMQAQYFLQDFFPYLANFQPAYWSEETNVT